jgi:hydroxyethylthiazole kinase-like sugar kinase family protein
MYESGTRPRGAYALHHACLHVCAGNVKGVDSTAASEAAIDAAKAIAREYGCIVAVSGATDYVRGKLAVY